MTVMDRMGVCARCLRIESEPTCRGRVRLEEQWVLETVRMVDRGYEEFWRRKGQRPPEA